MGGRDDSTNVVEAPAATVITPIGLDHQDALGATLTGAAVGLAGAWSLSGVLTSLVYGVSPRDALTLGAVTAGLIVSAAVAAFVPARRAGRLSPTVALREE